eukprot:3681501-Pleurochrysis_carterae.AAC.1
MAAAVAAVAVAVAVAAAATAAAAAIEAAPAVPAWQHAVAAAAFDQKQTRPPAPAFELPLL